MKKACLALVLAAVLPAKAAWAQEKVYAWCYWGTLAMDRQGPVERYFSAVFHGPKFGESSRPGLPSGMRKLTGRGDWSWDATCSAHDDLASAEKYYASTAANLRSGGAKVILSDYVPRGFVRAGTAAPK